MHDAIAQVFALIYADLGQFTKTLKSLRKKS